jgi:hypothetical protein
MNRDLDGQKDERPEGFNLQVHYRDDKTGLVVETDPYILRVVGESAGGKSSYFERPKGSGNLFNKRGEAIGRWVDGGFKADMPHVAFVAPLTQDQKLANSLVEKDSKIAELEREMAAIRAESARGSTKNRGS